jgi:CHAT domain-containing protein
VTADRLIIFVVTPRGFVVRTVGESLTSLGSRVQLARALLRQRGSEPVARGVLSALYGILVQPLVESGALSGTTRLIMIPHGPLAYLPTAALFDARSSRYLAEQYSIVRLSSAGSLARLRAPADAVSMGQRVAASLFAPFPDSLPATRDEVDAIARHVPRARIRLGTEATKRNLQRALQSGDIVHIATHARMNPRNPLFSAIKVSSGTGQPTAADARLEVHELLGMHVRSPLVFLSGCETALGGSWSTTFDEGEDYTTLAQALLYAGARNVVATLWRIDDAGAAAFASRFYPALGSGDVGEALARAQREMLGDTRYRSPYYWAAYEVSGAGLPFSGANGLVLSDKR